MDCRRRSFRSRNGGWTRRCETVAAMLATAGTARQKERDECD
jgi:hypothetical protein